MMMPLQDILNKYNIRPKGVISVGSHWAEEHEEFVRCGIEMFVYIEPSKESYKIMCKKLFTAMPSEWAVDFVNKSGIGNIYGNKENNIIAYNIACGAEEKEMPMYVSHQNQGQSNSFLKPKLHLIQHPEIIFDDAELVKVIQIDNLPITKEEYDFLYMDTEGYDGEVIKGAKETLKHINMVYSEVNRAETREGNILVEDMDKLMKEHGFVGVAEHWPSPNFSWGDKIYIRPKLLTSEDLDML